jgi:hypothetical protein
MTPRRALRDVDTADRVLAARLILFPAAGGVVLGVLAGFYQIAARGWGIAGAAGLVALGGAIGAALGTLGWLVLGRMSRGVVGLLTASGNLEPAASFSLQESLIMRGRYHEAARSFDSHLAARPDDDEARLALAGLLATHLADPEGAERLYRAVIDRGVNPRAQWVAGNALIDLFRSTGQRGRLMAELARFADRHRDTAAGAAAKRELLALKDGTEDPSRRP